jgi:Ca2+-binding RTX toxin-like protein
LFVDNLERIMTTSGFTETFFNKTYQNALDDFTTANGIAGFSINTALNATSIMIQQAARGTLGGRIYDAARLVQTTTVDYITKGAFNPDSYGEIAGIAGGLAVGLVAAAFLGPTIAGAAGAVAIGMVAGWIAEALVDTINEQYPNLSADFQGWLGTLGNQIVDAANDAWDAAQGAWDSASGSVADWWQNLSWGDLNGNGVPDWMNFPNPGSLRVDPLVIDLNGDGVKLAAVATSTAYFDYGGDGFREKTGWAAGGDGILVRDIDGNGLIESLPELLATQTQNVFQVLKTFDTNNDNKINANDSVWTSLKVWVDSDSDGITDVGELKTLSSLGLTEINLNSTPVSQWDNGNRIDATSTVTINGVAQQAQAVFFGTQANNAVFVVPTGFVPHQDVRLLPNFSGGGGVPPLYFSMTNDVALRMEVITLVQNAGTMTFAQLRTAVETMLLNWSGADNAVAGSRGTFIDARHVAAVEAFGGSTTATIVNAANGVQLEEFYQKLVEDYAIRFAVQSYVSAVSLAAQQTSPVVMGNHNFSYLSAFGFNATNNGLSVNANSFALNIIEAIKTAGGDPITVVNTGALTSAMIQSLAVADAVIGKTAEDFIKSTSWSSPEISSLISADDFAAFKVVQFFMAGGTIADVKIGTTSLDSLVFDSTDLFGFGRSGDDNITGNSRANFLFGGTSNDTLNGGAGNDTYVYNNSDGIDTITDGAFNGNADKLIFTGHSFAELKVANSSANSNLTLTFTDNADSVIVVNGGANINDNGIESFVFTGGVTKTKAELQALSIVQKQTAGADTILGYDNSADTFVGGLGNDALNGQSGNDTYNYNNGDGTDTITDGAFNGNTDKLVFTGHTFAELKVANSSANSNLTLTFTNNADSVIVVNGGANINDNGIESFVFTGGVTKTKAELQTLSIVQKQTSGADTILGYDNSTDSFTGGLGNDALNGLSGNDTYNYNNGDGTDTITDGAFNGSADKVVFTGHSFAELRVANTSANSNLTLTFTNNADSVVVVNGGVNANDVGVEIFQFTGGVTKTKAELQALSIVQKQTTGADTIVGYDNSADTFVGGLGNDTLNGNSGDDNYIYNNGDGVDTITEGAYNGSADKVTFTGHSFAELKVANSSANSNMTLTFTNNADSVVLVNGGINANSVGIESFVFTGGVTKTKAELQALSIVQKQTTGADTIRGYASSNDTFVGGAGNDTLTGLSGNDTFVFAAGFGKDVITDFTAGSAISDVLSLSLGTSFDTFAEVYAAAVQVGANTVINITANDTITLNGITKTSLVANDFSFF